MEEKIDFFKKRIRNAGIGFLNETELRDIINLRESFSAEEVELVEKILRDTYDTTKKRETRFEQAFAEERKIISGKVNTVLI